MNSILLIFDWIGYSPSMEIESIYWCNFIDFSPWRCFSRHFANFTPRKPTYHAEWCRTWRRYNQIRVL